MGATNFDPTHWSHWLLIGCFVGVSIWGLLLSWQWRREAQLKRRQSRLARRLAMELHSINMYDVSCSSGERSPSLAERLIVPSDE